VGMWVFKVSLLFLAPSICNNSGDLERDPVVAKDAAFAADRPLEGKRKVFIASSNKEFSAGILNGSSNICRWSIESRASIFKNLLIPTNFKEFEVQASVMRWEAEEPHCQAGGKSTRCKHPGLRTKTFKPFHEKVQFQSPIFPITPRFSPRSEFSPNVANATGKFLSSRSDCDPHP
jgi:hypothetical protein